MVAIVVIVVVVVVAFAFAFAFAAALSKTVLRIIVRSRWIFYIFIGKH